MNLNMNDPLNLRDYILFCVDFIRSNSTGDKQPRTILGYLSLVLHGVKESKSEEDALITTIQKLFSGNVSYTNKSIMSLSEEIISGQHDDILTENLQSLCATIDATKRSDAFYTLVLSMISLRFFDETEKALMQQKKDKKEHTSIHLHIFKHGFETLYNIPCFFADRTYEEALTYDYISPLRYALMKVAAENGNKNAAIEYANYISKNGTHSESFKYLLIALPFPSAMWNITFLIEKAWVGEEEERQFRAAVKIEDKLSAGDLDPYRHELKDLVYTGNRPTSAESMIFCYKVYFFLAYHGFYKGFNSMAKLLSNGTVSLKCDLDGQKQHTFALRDKYWKKAIKGCNITAISNEGNRLFREDLVLKPSYDPNATDVKYMVELMELAASMQLMHASYNLANFYEFDADHSTVPLKEQKQIVDIYQKAASLDLNGTGMNGNLYYRLGALSVETKEKKAYFERALQNGKIDAAYQLALICFDEYLTTPKAHMLLKCENFLRDYMPHFSGDVKNMANKLYIEVQEKLATQPF